MVVLIVVRTKIAKFGPGQFKFVLAKTEIAVFGPGQHHPARGGERFRRIFARARASASTGTRECYYFDRPRAGSPSQEATAGIFWEPPWLPENPCRCLLASGPSTWPVKNNGIFLSR